ncbi:MAG: topoisomerase protein [Microgenomates group bacterium GW2011_GWB1_40_9]|nr:MAG: topoisomerase protein [Microgenomates group bacterium GW2011_GWB1_40_9]
MTLIIVESPTKAKTLSKFLGKDYQIEATMGHIRDLPKAALGVDVEHGFTPSYLIPKDKKKHVGELLAIARKADTVILATDPDREGEAIAWHMATILTDGIEKKKLTKKTEKKIETFKRITFHEITKSAIDDALAHPGVIDTKLVSAQQARRILDRLVGYKLSPILWQKLSKRWLSAGRVQSVAVRLLVEREREIEKFTKEPYWTIEGDFSGPITAQLISHNEEIYEKQIILQLFDGKYTTTSSTIISEDQANAIIEDLKKPYTVSAVEKKEISRNPSPAYTTSTLQQDAGRRLYFSSKKTMQLAQKLYEEGIITYHRTDSLNLSTKFISEAREYIANTFGKKYIPASARVYHTKSKVAQEAHEAIRPTDVTFLEETLKNNPEFNAYVFQVQGSVIMFDGFLKVMGYENGEVVLPTVAVGDTVTLSKANSIFHETQAPPRYTEASLVKALEEKDIGRPSTYAPIISTIIDRQYVAKIEKKLVPTELGMQVTDFLVLYFPRVMDLPFTAKLEADLDAIATGEKEWVLVLKAFYDPFIEAVDTTMKTAEKIKSPVEETDEKCPLCQSPVVIRTGRYGKFYACSTFPACTYTKQKPETIDMKCPKCGSDIVIKKTRHGKTFFGCSTYPTCTFAAWKKEDIK